MRAIDEAHKDDNASNFSLWQRRMGHTDQSTIQRMVKSQAYGMNARLKLKTPFYETSVQTKGTEQPNQEDLIKSPPENTIQSDGCGPFPQPIIVEKKSFVALPVIRQRFRKVIFIVRRSENAEHCRNFILWGERNGVENVKRVDSEKAKEFLGMSREL